MNTAALQQVVTDPDIVWGADEIGRVIGLDPGNKSNRRKTFYVLETRELNGIPVKKVGRTYIASRTALLEWAKGK
ncbi:hypothetical protein ACDY96_11325 [Rhizobium mongolense]|uniref:hypothetical protein n=1 Tax=Rhizobium TaxID=379 RepID=UPI0024B1416B|nr:hypothetical protein [Rhizobium sp. CC1099]WFU87773.1 hypothetical protein QA644_01345 [Rhizobium sp. CC1099]